MDWYYAKHGRQEGPVGAETLRAKLHSGELAPSDLVWRDGMAEWTAAESVGELSSASLPPAGTAPPAVPVGSPSPGPPASPQPPMMSPVPPTSGLAIASMTCGIIGLFLTVSCFFLGAITGVPAVICGHAALQSIKRSPVPVQGRGMAIAGLVTGYLATLGTLVFVILIAMGIALGGAAAGGYP